MKNKTWTHLHRQFHLPRRNKIKTNVGNPNTPHRRNQTWTHNIKQEQMKRKKAKKHQCTFVIAFTFVIISCKEQQNSMSTILTSHNVTIHHHMFMCILQINTYSIYPLHTISITISWSQYNNLLCKSSKSCPKHKQIIHECLSQHGE